MLSAALVIAGLLALWGLFGGTNDDRDDKEPVRTKEIET